MSALVLPLSSLFRSTGSCWFAVHVPGVGPCRGPLERCHLLPKQRYPELPPAAMWDERAWVPGCELHHYRFDKGMPPSRPLRVARALVPPAFVGWVEQHGFQAMFDREFPTDEEEGRCRVSSG